MNISFPILQSLTTFECTVRCRYNNPRYNNMAGYNNIFSADQFFYRIKCACYNNILLINVPL